jgi:uncharacterized protein YjbJ (UPF0337 family)
MNESTAMGILDTARGKVKQTVGEATGNSEMANAGVAQQVKGHAEQVWGSVKDAAADLRDKVVPRDGTTPFDPNDPAKSDDLAFKQENHAHNLRESITSASAQVRDAIDSGLNKLKS